MKMDRIEMARLAAAEGAGRLDLYAGIHKAARALLAHTVHRVGCMDPLDEADTAAALAQVDELLDFCAAHLRHENEFVHPAMEARAPGSSGAIGREHGEHEQELTTLRGLVQALREMPATQRPPAAHGLYLHLAAFMAHNLEHMLIEETTHNAVLWAHYTDAELEAVHDALLASIGPTEMMQIMGWLLPALDPAARAGLLADLRAKAPAPAFDAVLALARSRLGMGNWAKLARSLGLAPVPGLVG